MTAAYNPFKLTDLFPSPCQASIDCFSFLCISREPCPLNAVGPIPRSGGILFIFREPPEIVCDWRALDQENALSFHRSKLCYLSVKLLVFIFPSCSYRRLETAHGSGIPLVSLLLLYFRNLEQLSHLLYPLMPCNAPPSARLAAPRGSPPL